MYHKTIIDKFFTVKIQKRRNVFGRKSNRAERIGRREKSGQNERFVKNATLRLLFRGSEMPLQDSKERSSLPCP